MRSEYIQIELAVFVLALILAACAPLTPSGRTNYPGVATAAVMRSRVAPRPWKVILDGKPIIVSEGIRFRDGWTLKWGESTGRLLRHFASVSVDCQSGRTAPLEKACVLPAELLPSPYDMADGFANFFHDRLFCAWLSFDSRKLEILEAALNDALGQPESSMRMVKQWSPGKLMVDLWLAQRDDPNALLVLTYKPIMKMMMGPMGGRPHP